ncbi:MAG: sulfotransferase [Pseudomonadota bacterium]
MTSAPHPLQIQAAQYWARGNLYGADDALVALIKEQGGPTPQTDLMTLRLALDLLEFDRADVALNRLRQSSETDPNIALSGVRLLTWQGQRDEALTLLNEALQTSPDHPGLIALLITHGRDLTEAQLNHAEHIARLLPETSPDKTGLLFPLARHYDRAGETERSWSLITEANRLSGSRMGAQIDPETLTAAAINRAKEAIDKARQLSHAAPHGQRHIYLIGAPRTGSSLIQSILSAHSGVDSSAERGALLPYIHEITDSQATAPSNHLARLQAADLSGLERAGRTAPVLIDKTTHNAFVAPLIKAIHPGSTFINVTRRPQDVALSMLFHEFPPAFPDSTLLEGITAMLEARDTIMRIYNKANFKVSDFNFDTFTEEPEKHGTTLGNLTGIRFEARFLQPENRNAAVPTFSAGQVRQPIKPTPPDKWKRFADFMPAAVKERLDALAGAA